MRAAWKYQSERAPAIAQGTLESINRSALPLSNKVPSSAIRYYALLLIRYPSAEGSDSLKGCLAGRFERRGTDSGGRLALACRQAP